MPKLVRSRDRLAAFLVVTLFAFVYAATLDTGLQPGELHGGDLITHQYAQVQARPSNAPGYPLYTMGGWLWFHGLRALITALGRPQPNPVPILGSYSALWALIALGLFYLLLDRLWLRRDAVWPRHLTAGLLTAFLGVTYFFWYYATTTEQYSSAVAQTLAILVAYLHWLDAPTQLRRLFLLALLCGVGLAHMLTVAFIVPPLVAAVLREQPSLLRRPRAVGGAILAAALPLVSYLYVYLRGAAHPEWWGQGDWASPTAWFWSFVSTAQGRSELAWAFEPGRPFLGNGFPELIWGELSWPLLLLGLIGVWRLPRQLNVIVVGTLAIYAVFCWLYRFGNWFQVILPAYPLILLGVAQLVQGLTVWRGRWRQPILALALIGLAAAVVWRASVSLPTADSRGRPGDTALDHAARLLGPDLPTDAAVFAAVDDALAIDYLTQIWGIRPDITILSSHTADRMILAGDPVYVTADAAPVLLGELTTAPLLASLTGNWLRVAQHQPVVQPPIAANYPITAGVTLTGYAVHPAATGEPVVKDPGAALEVLLFWEIAAGKWPAGLNLSVRPLRQGAPVIDPATAAPVQSDRPAPVHGLWRGGTDYTQAVDGYRLPLPAPADGLRVIVYTAAAGSFHNVAEIDLPLAQ